MAINIRGFVEPYSPWLSPEKRDEWQDGVPEFHRPVFEGLLSDLQDVEQMISVTGPRRVGKSTLLKQLVQHLIQVEKIPPENVWYYSFDDPALYRGPNVAADVIEGLMEHMSQLEGEAFLFLDEIQTLDRWELYLKKYYDLKYDVRIVVSGSASSPIFKKSRESLLGRVKDYHVLPFSFREYLLYQLRGDTSSILAEMDNLIETADELKGMFARNPEHLETKSVNVPRISDELWSAAEQHLETYLLEGGFPEVWAMKSDELKMEYLYDNQVKKVIQEDLVLAAEFRKPEQLKAFYISLLERPGQEVNLTKLADEADVPVSQVDKYLPLLEMTDLISHAGKFRKSAVRVRRGNFKCYLVDLALRNAVMRVGSEHLQDDSLLGLYAENLVFNALRKWQGILQVDFYRDGKQAEVDFVVHTRPSRYFITEVKYKNKFSSSEFRGIQRFHSRHQCHVPLIVTKNRDDHGQTLVSDIGCFQLPLIQFLLMFD